MLSPYGNGKEEEAQYFHLDGEKLPTRYLYLVSFCPFSGYHRCKYPVEYKSVTALNEDYLLYFPI